MKNTFINSSFSWSAWEDKSFDLIDAAQNGDFDAVNELLTFHGDEISSYHQGAALKSAAENGHIEIITELLTRCIEINTYAKQAALQSAIENNQAQAISEILTYCLDDLSNEEKGSILHSLAQKGYNQAIVELLDRCGGQIRSFTKGSALISAAKKGHAQVIIEILSRYHEEISSENKDMALFMAAEAGHSPVVVELLARCGADISNAKKGLSLINATQYGHSQVIVELLNHDSAAISDTHKVRAMQLAVQQGHLDALNSLLSYNNVATLATFNNNQILTEAQMRVNGDNEDRARYQPIIDRLMQVEAVANLVNGQAQQPVTTLANITQFAENSMQSLNAQERNIVSHLKSHYKSIYNEKNFEVIRAEILSYLEESYKKSPACDKGSPLPLEYTANLSNSALESYYKHLNHGAWRYLSDSNPWMAADAKYIQILEDGRKVAIISDADKELLSYIWIALNDETVKLEEGFTVEGNKNVFVQNLGELNRAHNHDERAENSEEQQAYLDKVPGIKTTRADDLEADKPTCVYGVTKRLLESPYGHPHIKPLDPKLMQNWMEALLFGRKEKAEDPDNIADRLDKLSLHELKNIQENLMDAMSGEEFVCHPALQIPQQQLDAFIEKVKTWYGADEITQERNPKLVLNPAGSGFIAEKHISYVALIQFCANDAMNCFAQGLNTYLTARIQSLEELEKSDVELKNVNSFTPSYDASKSDSDADPETKVQNMRP